METYDQTISIVCHLSSTLTSRKLFLFSFKMSHSAALNLLNSSVLDLLMAGKINKTHDTKFLQNPSQVTETKALDVY